ncbi:MAG: DNA polymerase III subunit beta [Candidatus Paceibacterota bacterium]
MEFECNKEKIQEALSLAERMVGKNLSLDILGFILITTKGDTLQIRSTNLDVGIEITIPIKTKKEGSIALPCGIISNLLSNIHDTIINFKIIKNNNLSITTKNTTTTIKTKPHTDFPLLPKINNKDSLKISTQDFLLGINSVSYSSATSDIKPEISSIFIYNNANTLIFVATDSFRLAEKKIDLKSDIKQNLSLLIPFKNIIEISKVLSNKGGELFINFDKNQISLQVDTTYITSRLVDGVFPDYKQIIPKEFTTEAVVLKEDFIDALKVTNLFSDKFNKITITIEPVKKVFEISSHNSDLGENKTTLSASISGEGIYVNFNHRYINDCLSALKKDSLVLKMNNETQPMIIKGVHDENFIYLIMPLNS